MIDFTLLSDRIIELMRVCGALFFIALVAFIYILIVTGVRVFRYKKKIEDKNDDFLICDVAYFLEKGKREAQEDSFYISPMAEFPSNGLIAAVSDGMGGLANGEDISSYIISRLKESYPVNFDDTTEVAGLLRTISDEIYDKYKLSSGATIVMVHIKDNFMNFYSSGDSNIILMRGDKATLLNQRQNYVSYLVKKMAEGGISTHDAYTNNRARALTDFMGNHECRILKTSSPIRLFEEDVILVTSDGVTDTVNLGRLAKYISPQLSARTSAERLKYAIRGKKNKRQDNYTGIVIKMERSFL
ncbi:MAG: protein phosphatase 2C family protein [Saccharofermentans sp.]|nr:protein phosphatase 2C family protein [Saccharofermentans sp.]